MTSQAHVTRTMCPMNCHPTLCGMLVEVEGGRVVRVAGDPDNPDSRGFLCIRGHAAREILDNPKRLLHPMIRARRDGEWRRATWDEALDLIVLKMRDAGREAVATWSGHGLFANNYGMRLHSHLLRRFSNLYGCQWWNPTMICWGLGAFGLGLTGALDVNTKEDMGAHLYLMPKVLEPAGECRPAPWILTELARRLEIADFFPWPSEEGAIDEILDHPSTGHATVAALRAEGGIRALQVSHVAYEDHAFHTPSGKIEFSSERAETLGLPALPVHDDLPSSPAYSLVLRQGRTLTHFHGFYDHGRALPALAAADPEPELWIAPADAARRAIGDGAAIRIWNERGAMQARARVTTRIPAGTVWMRDGWDGLNTLTSGRRCLPDAAVDAFGFSAGQASFDARVDVAPA